MADVNSTQLETYIERIERLNEDKKNILADIREVYAQADSEGFDKKAIREVIKLRAIAKEERELQDATLETYRNALNV